MRIAVIGAGTAGLCAAKHAMQNGLDVTIFEQTAQVGGTWVYTDTVGKDNYGLEVHTSMYQGLHTNLPKEIMGFPELPLPAQDKSYLPAEDVVSFLELYAKTFRVVEKIKFEHYVIRVRPIGASQWEIIYRDLPQDRVELEIFDGILVCNGHYSTPFTPDYPGRDEYEGLQIHSHDFRNVDRFHDETVLVIGAGPSGRDMAYQIAEKAQRLTLSHHRQLEPESVFPSNAVQKPDIKRLTKTGAEFVDGTHQTFSVIFYCTGYKYTFPFLSVDCGITVDENYVQPLYKHCINIKRPTMALIGIPFQVAIAPMIDLQVRFAIKFLSGKKALPSKLEMLQDTADDEQWRKSKGYLKRLFHAMGNNRVAYYADLAATAEVDNIKTVLTKIHDCSTVRFKTDLLNFRKDVYQIVDDDTFIHIT